MRALIVSATLIVAAMAPTLTQAQDAPTTGVYANLGYSSFGIGSFDVPALQGRLGYRLNSWLGVEAELAGGIKKDKSGLLQAKLDHEEAVYGVAFLPLTSRWDLIGRLGYGHSKVTLSVPDGSTTGFQSSGGADHWNVGGGVQYHFDGQNGIRGDYTRQEYRGGDGRADVWSVAYSRRF